MATLFQLPKVVPVDSSGQPYAGAKLYFYAVGTTTQQSPYTDAALTTPHAQPVVADSSGVFPAIYLNPNATGDYRVQLKTSADVLIYDQDNIPRFLPAVVLITNASASGSAGFRLPHGTAPSSPVNGDVWTTTGGMFVRINGVTKTVTLT